MKSIDVSERWENYRKANTDKPSVRENELRKIFFLVNPQKGQKILEVGTGNGYLTFPIAQAVGQEGEVVTTDVNEGNIKDVVDKNESKRLSLVPILLSPKAGLLTEEKYKDYFDTVTTIATLHHFDNRIEKTGDSGRKKAIKCFYQNLKSGGKLVIADVLNGTISQKYFDSIDNPEHCHPLGHPHDFFNQDQLLKAVQDAGFKNIKIEVASVPWKFISLEEAKKFVHTIHNAKCSPEESMTVADRQLGIRKIDDHYELGWELFFLVAEK
jgi:SAM-dependent methyltransferase